MESNAPLYIGIDGGGSKCSAHLFNADKEVIGQGISGPANASRDLTQSISSILDSVNLALIDAKLSLDYLPKLPVCAGLAGANIPSVKEQLLQWQHPFASFNVDSDVTATCYGAHDGKDGALLIVGTGSSAARFQSGIVTQLGGHGFLLGDKGSGAWLGRAAVTSTLEALDDIIAISPLHDRVLSRLSVTSSAALLDKMMTASSKEFGMLAPDIIELATQDEANALRLIKEATTYLESLCMSTLQYTDLPLVLMGGLAPFFEPWFNSSLRARIVKAKAGPEKGALHLLPPNGS